MTVANFLERFSNTSAAPTLAELAQPVAGSLNKFIEQFSGFTESYWFYDHTIELRFEPKEHVYYLVDPEVGNLVAQDGVTTVCHIIDKSNALVPWSAKMVVEKLLRNLPQFTKDDGGVYIPEMVWDEMAEIALDAKSAPRDKVDEASDVGKVAHDWLEHYIKAILAADQVKQNQQLSTMCADERARNCCYAALSWMKSHNVRWIETERKVFSKKYGYAGTMDGLALVDSCDDPTCCTKAFKDRLSIIDWKSSNYLYIEYLFQTASYEQAYEEEFGVDVEDRWVLRLGKESGEFDPWHLEADDFADDFQGFLDALNLTRSVRLVAERMAGQKTKLRTLRKEIKAEAKAKAEAEEKAAKTVAKEAKKAATAAAKVKDKADKEASEMTWAEWNESKKAYQPQAAPLEPEVINIPQEQVLPMPSIELPVERI